MYSLLYKQHLDLSLLSPSLTMDNFINLLNISLDKNLDQLTNSDRNLLAKAVRLNWLIEHLKNNTILKPLLLNLKYFSLNVVVGDTRLLAAMFNNHIRSANALLTIKSQYRDQFLDWTEIEDLDHLSEILKINPDQILFTDNKKVNWKNTELDWIEFSLSSTVNHMHNETERFNIMLNYINCRPENFQFTIDWFTTPIDWNLYNF